MMRTVNLSAQVAVIHGPRRLNLTSAPDLREAIQDAVRNGRAKLVIDLTAVESIDSSGIGALVMGRRSTRALGGDLRIVSPTRQVSTMLRLALLSHLFVMCESAETAYED